MSSQSSIHFYATKFVPVASSDLVRLFELLGGREDVLKVTREREMRQWEGRAVGEVAEFIVLRRRMSLAQVDSFFTQGELLILDWFSNGAGLREDLLRQSEHSIPPPIRGDFLPNNAEINIGWHDVYGVPEGEDERFFARAFLSLRFWGYGGPQDMLQYRSRVERLPATTEIRDGVARIIRAPLLVEVYTSL